jgi:hypothetical protein
MQGDFSSDLPALHWADHRSALFSCSGFRVRGLPLFGCVVLTSTLCCMLFRVKGSGFRVQGLRFMVYNTGLRV